MPSALLVAPGEEPVSLADLKAQLRLEDSSEDALLTGLISAARGHVEMLTRRVLIVQSWRLYLDNWPKRSNIPPFARRIPLSPNPVRRIVSVTLYDLSGVPLILAPALYRLDAARAPACLIVDPALGRPNQGGNGIEIDFEAGYGDASTVPAPLRQAILRLAALWFEHRHDGDIAMLSPTPAAVEALIAPYRVL